MYGQTTEKFLKLVNVVHYDSTFSSYYGWPQNSKVITISSGKLMQVQSILLGGNISATLNSYPIPTADNSKYFNKLWLKEGDVLQFIAGGCGCSLQGFKMTLFEFVIE